MSWQPGLRPHRPQDDAFKPRTSIGEQDRWQRGRVHCERGPLACRPRRGDVGMGNETKQQREDSRRRATQRRGVKTLQPTANAGLIELPGRCGLHVVTRSNAVACDSRRARSGRRALKLRAVEAKSADAQTPARPAPTPTPFTTSVNASQVGPNIAGAYLGQQETDTGLGGPHLALCLKVWAYM
ncbi:hypothetical protein EXIGLDRAFT_193603 [Exidia glandulosa HHB12029]|uniref:Uncharacterized protein n=1 Tax=Exidia glandulosa HHB12029 TaxID=1314781 RepID=A0A165EWT8_EXIGL|nr:hypothetical protein EXIGLDRAFT_193603 [Exidia glandulosa HHB12029]